MIRVFGHVVARPGNHVHHGLDENSSLFIHPGPPQIDCARRPGIRIDCTSGRCVGRGTSTHDHNVGRSLPTPSAPAVEVLVSSASARSARLAHVGVVRPLLWFDEVPPLAALAASNTTNHAITRASMPGHDVVDWFGVGFWHDIGRSPNRLAAVAEERVDLCHHSSPQQIMHLPLRCFGLHLSPCSPWTLPLAGATCSASLPMFRCIAFNTAV
jgi:hypothetical protein